MSKFETKEEYLAWCESTITKIYYANIAMNNEGIRDAVQEISKKLWVSESDTLIKE